MCFCVSRFVACDLNYDRRQWKTPLWRRLLNFRVRVILKSAVRKCIEINLKNLWILGLNEGLKPHCKIGFPPLHVITVVSRKSGNNAQVVISRIGRKKAKKIFKLNFVLSVFPDTTDCSWVPEVAVWQEDSRDNECKQFTLNSHHKLLNQSFRQCPTKHSAARLRSRLQGPFCHTRPRIMRSAPESTVWAISSQSLYYPCDPWCWQKGLHSLGSSCRLIRRSNGFCIPWSGHSGKAL